MTSLRFVVLPGFFQGVVKELRIRGVAEEKEKVKVRRECDEKISHLEDRAKLAESKTKMATNDLESLNSRLNEMSKTNSREVEELNSKLGAASAELNQLRRKLSLSESELQKKMDAIADLNTEMARTVKIRSEKADLEAAKMISMRKRHSRQIQDKEDVISSQRAEISSLRERLKEMEVHCQEKVEISSSAAEAADRRAQRSESRLKKISVQVKLQRLVLQGLLAERATVD